MGKRWCYPGREFTKADNPKLPHPIRVLPGGSVYARLEGGDRRLDAIVTRPGLAICTREDAHILITRSGQVLVGDEITRMKKDEPTIEQAIADA